MSENDSKAVRAGNAYFKGNEDRDRKGSAMDLIAKTAAATKAKSAKLKAARQERDVAEQVAKDATEPAPVKRRRKPAS